MSHIDPDTLTAYALDVLEDPVRDTVRGHLESCTECAGFIAAIRTETDRLASVRLPVPPVSPPPLRVRRRVPRPWMRIAAILVVGFLAGFLTAEALRKEHVTVVRQEFRPAAVPSSEAARASCQAVDIARVREM